MPDPEADTPAAAASPSTSASQIFTSTFFTIFLAELGDKTQVTTVLMSAESHSPWIVFLGAGTALVTTSLLGVLVGKWLAQHISPRLLDFAAGLTLVTIGIWLGWDIWQGGI
ncbi:MAG: TMEM165/GDT1 family protein [Cyanobacteria bacterium P01_H01_bin.121]